MFIVLYRTLTYLPVNGCNIFNILKYIYIYIYVSIVSIRHLGLSFHYQKLYFTIRIQFPQQKNESPIDQKIEFLPEVIFRASVQV